jgi:hypothetical protein
MDTNMLAFKARRPKLEQTGNCGVFQALTLIARRRREQQTVFQLLDMESTCAAALSSCLGGNFR